MGVGAGFEDRIVHAYFRVEFPGPRDLLVVGS